MMAARSAVQLPRLRAQRGHLTTSIEHLNVVSIAVLVSTTTASDELINYVLSEWLSDHMTDKEQTFSTLPRSQTDGVDRSK
jgi:hypothetical protein